MLCFSVQIVINITKPNIETSNMENELKILGFAGSLRKGSYNRSLLRSAAQLLPSDTTLEIFDLSDIPHNVYFLARTVVEEFRNMHIRF